MVKRWKPSAFARLLLILKLWFLGLAVCILLSEVVLSQETPLSLVDRYYAVTEDSARLLPHRRSYLIPFSYNDNPYQKPYESLLVGERSERGSFVDKLEAEFQISFSILTNRNLFNSGFDTFVAYTSLSWWQVYNEDWSRQFRETNHAPEIFGRYIFKKPVDVFGLKLVAYDLGYIHESNGQIQELSRSWDRIFVRTVGTSGKFFTHLMAWYRIPDYPDENEDIQDYRSFLTASFYYASSAGLWGLELKPGYKKSGVTITNAIPWKEGLEFFAKIDYGYGHSLVDYPNKTQRIGVGIKLADPFVRSANKNTPSSSRN